MNRKRDAKGRFVKEEKLEEIKAKEKEVNIEESTASSKLNETPIQENNSSSSEEKNQEEENKTDEKLTIKRAKKRKKKEKGGNSHRPSFFKIRFQVPFKITSCC